MCDIPLQLLFLVHLFVYVFTVYMCMCLSTYNDGGQPAGIGPSFLASEFRHGTEVVRLGNKCLYLLSHLNGLIYVFVPIIKFFLFLWNRPQAEKTQGFGSLCPVPCHVFARERCYFRAFRLSISFFSCVDKTEELNPPAVQTWHLITSDCGFLSCEPLLSITGRHTLYLAQSRCFWGARCSPQREVSVMSLSKSPT